ncbi:MAG TPA: deoxyguanosinetriphosphate triphosphohydrolase [Lachnospiraceae bacterium]|nr:deoxyguanosinetriphosphate triphosphohydrolase [uncultured Lachnoclostridium sp.]HAU88230.1 deoxyguanosinetriphosphate triphosphohydrolase [Lachnospiraceae bacterium]
MGKELILNLRQRQEQWEHEHLSPYASFSDKTRGRDVYEEPCDIRPSYQRDRDRILHCKSFRRLKHKTQVFLAPEGDHYRTRLTHTLEVAQTARTIARALRLNEDLAEAIALGHDLGHTPFGHAGERALNGICPDGFEHAKQSLRVVEVIEKNGQGLNLTKEVRDGIVNHQTKGKPSTLEGKIVRISDKIAYVNSDIDDAIRGKIITEEEIPKELIEILGNSTRKRLDVLIHDVVHNSEGKNEIAMSKGISTAIVELRAFMFKNVYTNPKAKGQEKKAEHLVEQLYEYYCKHPECMPDEYQVSIAEGLCSKERVVCDYVAGMTDRYSISKYKEIMIPDVWNIY